MAETMISSAIRRRIGRSILKKNEKLFGYCESLEDVEFAFEQYGNEEM